jgi:hypothetical protein
MSLLFVPSREIFSQHLGWSVVKAIHMEYGGLAICAHRKEFGYPFSANGIGHLTCGMGLAARVHERSRLSR